MKHDGSTVTVTLLARSHDRAEDRERLAEVVGRHVGEPVTIVQICENCGGPHGRPVVVGRENDTWASLSRTGDVLAVAVADAGPIGIDIESVAAVGRAALDAWSPRELEFLATTEDRPRATTALWTAKEAILKCDGRGLRVDPRELTVVVPPGGAAGPGRLESWGGVSGAGADIRLELFDAGDDLVGSVATAGGSPPRLVLLDERQRKRGSGAE